MKPQNGLLFFPQTGDPLFLEVQGFRMRWWHLGCGDNERPGGILTMAYDLRDNLEALLPEEWK